VFVACTEDAKSEQFAGHPLDILSGIVAYNGDKGEEAWSDCADGSAVHIDACFGDSLNDTDHGIVWLLGGEEDIISRGGERGGKRSGGKGAAMKDEAWRERIVCDPEVHHGEPCIRGTRIPVPLIVGSLADWSIEQLLSEYPQLLREDIEAALRYAAEAARNTMVA
jgi:uncharacterized protein (DUF433 family)